MSDIDLTLAALREAVRLSPDNIALAEHFGKTLLSYLRFEEAEQHFKFMLARNPNSNSLKLMMADTYYRQNKNSHALAIVETMTRQNRPCVLFFDEVDALGASRSDMRQSAGRHLVNQFLAEMDGTQSNNEGVLVLGATNAPWHVDAAFRRPGRFDQVLFVPPPDVPARVETIRILLEGKPVQDVDHAQVAAKTNEFSGADLKAVVDRAIEGKLQEAIRSGKPTPLTTKDLLASAKSVKPSTREWFSTARNHALYANQGGTYDDILEYLKLK